MSNAYTLVVDNQPERQQTLVKVLGRLNTEQAVLPKVKICDTPAQAIAFSSAHTCPIIFTSIDLPGMNGFAMIQQIRKQNGRTNFILLADRKEYVIQALLMKLRLSGSIMGAPNLDNVTDQLNNLWYPLQN